MSRAARSSVHPAGAGSRSEEPWTRVLHRKLARFERQVERKWFRFRRARGWLGPATIQAFLDFGTPDLLNVSGRVLAWASDRRPRADDPWWRNFLSLARAFTSDELPDARIRARTGSVTREAVTDQDGYFRLRLPVDPNLPPNLWRSVDLELINDAGADLERPWEIARVLVPPPTARFGVISDLDDTVLHTHTTEFWRMLRISMFRNALTRTPLDGVAAFYRSLQAGVDGEEGNPIFYVSSSAWNLYDLMRDFLEYNGIPRGPILLREARLDDNRFGRSNNDHKRDKIRRILETYPDLPFVMIGDSSEDDPRLYADALERYPGRVRAIYIRDVAEKNRGAVRRLARDVDEQGSSMLLIKHTLEAARHAVEDGMIAASALADIEREGWRNR